MSNRVEHLGDEIDNLINRFRMEYDMTYAEAVGVLFMKAQLLCNEAAEEGDSPHA